MLNALSQNYERIVKKLPQRGWQIALYILLIISWGIILIGTYLLFNQ